MNLPVPVPSVDPGPDYALNLNACMDILDQHDHTNGNGQQVPVAGININANLPFNGHNAITLRSARLQSQPAPLALGNDLSCVYSVLGDLYYNDADGNQIRITQSGAVVGSPGTISGLVSPASATYVSSNQTFVWQSDVDTGANMDLASLILRNMTANSFGLTLEPPNAMAADYTLTLPELPGVTKIMALDASGNMTAAYTVDGSTLNINGSSQLEVKAGGITGTQLTSGIAIPGNPSITGSSLTINGVALNASGSTLRVAQFQVDTSGPTLSKGAVAGGLVSTGSEFYPGTESSAGILAVNARTLAIRTGGGGSTAARIVTSPAGATYGLLMVSCTLLFNLTANTVSIADGEGVSISGTASDFTITFAAFAGTTPRFFFASNTSGQPASFDVIGATTSTVRASAAGTGTAVMSFLAIGQRGS